MGEMITRNAEMIEHKGVQIVKLEFVGMSGQELADGIKLASRAMIPKLTPGKREWLNITIFTDCFFNETALKALSNGMEGMSTSFIAVAVVGMHNIQQIGLDIAASSSKTEFLHRFFEDVDEAKDWLVTMHSKHVG